MANHGFGCYKELDPMAHFDGLATGIKHCFAADVAHVDVEGKDELGAPLAGWFYRVKASDGSISEGQLDAAGHARVPLGSPGPVEVRIAELRQQLEPASGAGAAPLSASPFEGLPDATDPGESKASARRRLSLAAWLPQLK